MLTLPHQQLIRFIDTTIKKQKFGTLTLTVIVKNGIPVVSSARIVKMKRRKYKVPSTHIDKLPRE